MIINHSHHDALFKTFLSDVDIARDFFQIHLPPSLRQRCNFNTLSLCSGSFVEKNLRTHYSDMLYSMRTRKGTGYIYCLVEHQSSPHRLMAFRLLRYSLAAMQQHLDQGHKTLPVVVPLLFYQGGLKGGYPYDNDWFSCFRDAELARDVYTRPFPVIDLSVISDGEIKTHRRVALLELVQKHIRLRDMSLLVEDIIDLLNQWQPSEELCKSLITYIAQAGKTDDAESFARTLSQHAPLCLEEEDMMTIAQHYELIGLKKGKQEGKQEGKNVGRMEGKLEVARRSLADGTDRALVKKWTGLTDEELDCLVNQ